MANFDNVVEASTFVGFSVGQLISKKVFKNYTIWVYENAVIKTEGKKSFFWNPEGGQELFVIFNKLPIVETYVPSAKMELAKQYKAAISEVYKGFKSIKDDRENGIVRDFTKVNKLGKALGRNIAFVGA